MSIQFPNSRRKLLQQLCRRKSHDPKPRADLGALRDRKDIQNKLTEELDKEFETIDERIVNNINELNDMITTTVKKCVERVCPKIDPVRKRQPWEDETLNQQMKDLKKFHDRKERRKLQKSIKRR